jgi:hypothetical protein
MAAAALEAGDSVRDQPVQHLRRALPGDADRCAVCARHERAGACKRIVFRPEVARIGGASQRRPQTLIHEQGANKAAPAAAVGPQGASKQ